MTWDQRIREAAYTSPDGVRVPFDYENVSHELDLAGGAFNFPDAVGTFIQPMGRSSRRYPIRAIFWGPDCDLQAARFEAAISARGVGRLEHPAYGAVDAVPLGPVSRRDDLKTAANQAVVEVTFWETIGLVYPTAQTDPRAAVLSALGRFNAAGAAQFAATVDTRAARFRAGYTSALDAVGGAVGGVASAQDNVRRQFDAINASINRGLDVLVGDPLALAAQTILLIQAPGRAATAIADRLAAYANLARSIISGGRAASDDLFALGAVSGSVVSAVNAEFETRGDAIRAAEAVLDQFAEVVAWRDGADGIDTGEAYQQLQDAVALTAGFLVDISFSLKQERRIVLDRDRTIIDLAAELYGSVDDRLDFIIDSNGLTGSEILELPRGRAILYYV